MRTLAQLQTEARKTKITPTFSRLIADDDSRTDDGRRDSRGAGKVGGVDALVRRILALLLAASDVRGLRRPSRKGLDSLTLLSWIRLINSTAETQTLPKMYFRQKTTGKNNAQKSSTSSTPGPTTSTVSCFWARTERPSVITARARRERSQCRATALCVFGFYEILDREGKLGCIDLPSTGGPGPGSYIFASVNATGKEKYYFTTRICVIMSFRGSSMGPRSKS